MTESFQQKKERNNLKSSDGFYLQPDIRIVGVVWTLIYLFGESTTNNTKIKQSNKTEKRTFDIVLSVSRTQLKAGTGLFISGATTFTNLSRYYWKLSKSRGGKRKFTFINTPGEKYIIICIVAVLIPSFCTYFGIKSAGRFAALILVIKVRKGIVGCAFWTNLNKCCLVFGDVKREPLEEFRLGSHTQ